jgi:predicted MFS family arabinose efflux permease
MGVLAFATASVVTTEFIVVGLLPLLAHELAVPLPRTAWLVSAFALSAALAGPPLTLIAVRWPPRAALTGMLLVFGLGGLVAGLLPHFEVNLVVRVLQGAVLTPFVSIASAVAVGMAAEGRAGRAIGQVNLGVVAGSVLAIPAGVVAASGIGWEMVYVLLGLFTLLGAALAWTTLPAANVSPAPVRAQLGLLGLSRFVLHLILSVTLFSAMFASYSYIAAWLGAVMGLDAPGVALALLGFGMVGAAGNFIAGHLVERGPLRLAAAIAVLLPITTSALSLAGDRPIVSFSLLAIWGAVHTAAFLACQARVIFEAPQAPAFAGSLNIAACNLGIALGAIIGGYFVGEWGIERFGHASAGPSAVALLVAGLLLGRGSGRNLPFG